MAIFNSYVNLPEGKTSVAQNIPGDFPLRYGRGFIRIGFSTSGSSLILGESEEYDFFGGRDSEPLIDLFEDSDFTILSHTLPYVFPEF